MTGIRGDERTETSNVYVGPSFAGRTFGKALLALNNAHAEALSWLEPDKLRYLAAHAFLARRIGDLDAFILALDQDASYDSPNFLWFRALCTIYLCGSDRGRLIRARARLRASALSRPVRPSVQGSPRARGL